MERMQEAKASLLDAKRNCTLQLDLIKEEKELKDINSKKFLERALAKGTYIEKTLLNKALNIEEQALLTEDLLKKEVGKELSKQFLLDKLQAEKFREIRKNEVLAKEKIKELNEVRMKLHDQEEQILRDKGIFENIRKKGLDFLTEVELGNAPPMAKLRANINSDNFEDYRHRRSKEDIMKLGQLIVDHGGARIDRMHRDLAEFKLDNDLNEDWKVELKSFFEGCDSSAFNAAKSAMAELLIKVNKGIDQHQEG